MKTRLLLFILLTVLAAQSRAQSFGALDTLFQNNLSGGYNGGVVCVVSQNNQVIYNKSFGSLNNNSLRMVASVSKTLSAVVLMSLVDDGLLNLDDSIGKYLPVFTAYGKGHCTIRQCFSHTGGWPGGDDYISSGTLTLAQSVDSIAVNIPLAYAPGTAFLYGGISMQIVGRIAEIAGGEPWKDLFRQRLTNKLGMSNTTFCLPGTNPRIAGGVCSTPNDLQKFALMLLNKGRYGDSAVISENAWNELWKDQTNKAPVMASPYPAGAPFNNPYYTDTVRYGIGTWQDIVNPNTLYHEQISAAGAFGSVIWIDRCRNVTGLIFTFSNLTSAILPDLQAMDMVRERTWNGCSATAVSKINAGKTSLRVYPNPAHHETVVQLPPGEIQVSITDMAGHILQNISAEGASLICIPLQHLPAGTYIIHTGSQSQPLIKY